MDSKPSNFQIWVNDRNSGRVTPDTLPYLESGNYKIELKKPNWRDTTFILEAVEGEMKSKNIDLLKNPKMYGKIKFRSVPTDADIFLNDSLMEWKTPYLLNKVLPGKYRVGYAAPEHRKNNMLVTVESNSTADAFYKLRDTTKWVDYLTFNSDIPTDVFTCLAIDKDDVKWLGTINMGLICLKGNKYSIYDVSNSGLPGNQIQCIELDKNDNLWIGTNAGLAVFDRTDWTTYNKANAGFSSNIVTAVAFSPFDGNVWIGTWDGITKKNGDKWKTSNFVSGVDPLTVSSIMVEKSNRIWVGTTRYGLFVFDGKFFVDLINWDVTPFTESTYKYSPTQNITDIEMDQSGGVWIGSNFAVCTVKVAPGNRILRLTRNGGISMHLGDEWNGDMFVVAPNTIEDIYIDDRDEKWVSTRNGIVVYSDIGYKRRYTVANSELTHHHITGVSKESDGTYWITTFGGGLNKYKGKR